MTDAGVQRMANQLTGAVAGGLQGVAFVGGNQHESAGRRHLNKRGVSVAAQAIEGADKIAHRPHDRQHHHFTLGGLNHCLHRPLAAVGDRQTDALRLRENRGKARLNRLGAAAGAYAFFERVRCNNYFHGSSFLMSLLNTIPGNEIFHHHRQQHAD